MKRLAIATAIPSRIKHSLFILIGVWVLTGSIQARSLSTRLDDYNIVWAEQSQDASESMPLVGGDIGCNVWVEGGDILLYIQRSGSLSENGEYLKMGRFRLQLNPDLFAGETRFRQELKLADGLIEIESRRPDGQTALITLWVDVHSSVVHMEVEASREMDVILSYESWRTQDKELLPVKTRRDRFTCFSLEGYPGKVIRVKDHVSAANRGILFYHRNPREKLIPELLIKQQRLEKHADTIYDDLKDRTFGGLLFGEGLTPAGTGEGTYQVTPYRSWQLRSEKARRHHHILIATHVEQATLEAWHDHLDETVRCTRQNNGSAHAKTISWWRRFWERSHILVQPSKPDPSDPVWQMSRNYQLFRYQLGGNAFGEYPTKFNGGNLIYDPVLVNKNMVYEPDWRQWGGAVHTAQNQRLLYWPMLKAGDDDAILAQFELYRKGLPGATARVKTHFGHKGAVFSEYMSAPGIVFGAGWGWEGNGHRARGEEIPFGDPRATGARGYHDMAEVGVMANQSCAYHWESQVEHAYMILEYHRFSGKDISRYMPFVKAAILFFDEHYQLRQKMRTGQPLDEKGKLIIYPSTSCESYRGARNPSDLIAGLRACVKSLLQLDGGYVSSDEKDYYRGYLDRIPDFAFDEQDGKTVMKPADSWLKEANQELPQFYPLFPFDQFRLGDTEIEVFKNTYAQAPAFRKGTIQSWHQDGIFFARMGMTAEAADYNTRKLQDSPRRYPTFWGPGHDWVPDHNWGGSGMIGLQEMLLQTIGDQILLFPAWPKAWDVDFKLHAPYKTTVEGLLKDGKLVELRVHPESRRQDVIIGLQH